MPDKYDKILTLKAGQRMLLRAVPVTDENDEIRYWIYHEFTIISGSCRIGYVGTGHPFVPTKKQGSEDIRLVNSKPISQDTD